MMVSINKVLILFILVLLVSACTQAGPAPWVGPELSQPRDQLTVAELQQNRFLPFADMSYFAKPEWASEAAHSFSGSLSFADTRMIFPKERNPYAGENTFPAFTVDFIADEGALIPLQTGPIITRDASSSFWDVIVGTGAVWQEENDGAWSRASFPLSLIDRYMGQVRNCVGTFVYQPDEMSNVYVQCSQESADYNDNSGGDIRVMLRDVGYQPKTFPNAAAVIARHAAHESRRLPVLPLSTIDADGEIAAYFNKSLRIPNAAAAPPNCQFRDRYRLCTITV
ncbi:MAG: hypothetical protein M9918_17110 [Anaerolineae bacterium]|nr:hypothetical protein [Anaerolineae bacterium]